MVLVSGFGDLFAGYGYPIFTAHKRSLRRLCFYRCLSVHRGACVTGACMVGGHVWQGGMRGGGAWQGGMCGGGVHGRGSHAWQGGQHA